LNSFLFVARLQAPDDDLGKLDTLNHALFHCELARIRPAHGAGEVRCLSRDIKIGAMAMAPVSVIGLIWN
jgi:hypothetical protein